ncbi:MAG: peptidoglycan-binding protein [Nanobdellota archaeon]
MRGFILLLGILSVIFSIGIAEEQGFDTDDPATYAQNPEEVIENFDTIVDSKPDMLIQKMDENPGLRSRILEDKETRDTLFLKDNSLLNRDGYRTAAKDMFNDKFTGCTFTEIDGDIESFSEDPLEITTAKGSLALGDLQGGDYDVSIEEDGRINLNGRSFEGQITGNGDTLAVDGSYMVDGESYSIAGDIRDVGEGRLEGTFTEFNGISGEDLDLTYQDGIVTLGGGRVDSIDEPVRIAGRFTCAKEDIGSFMSDGAQITVLDNGDFDRRYTLPKDTTVNLLMDTPVDEDYPEDAISLYADGYAADYESGGATGDLYDMDLPPRGYLDVGDSGVEQLQRQINAELRDQPGFEPISVDGIYGPETKNAVRELQRKYGLTQDGLFGSNTKDALMQTTNMFEVQRYDPNLGSRGFLSPGNRGVEDVQRILNEELMMHEDFEPLQVDGVYGPKTEAAVKMLQRQYGLTVDGKFGSQTTQVLSEAYQLTGEGGFRVVETESTMEYSEGAYQNGDPLQTTTYFKGDFNYGRFIAGNDGGYQPIIYTQDGKVMNEPGYSYVLDDFEYFDGNTYQELGDVVSRTDGSEVNGPPHVQSGVDTEGTSGLTTRTVGLNPQEMDPEMKQYVMEKAQGAGLDPKRLLQQMKLESQFDPYALSPDNCVGYGQISEIAVDDINANYGTSYGYDDRWHPKKNVDMAVAYLGLLDRRVRNKYPNGKTTPDGRHYTPLEIRDLYYVAGSGNTDKFLNGEKSGVGDVSESYSENVERQPVSLP